MSQPFADRTRSRLVVLFAGVCTLAACGGGGGGDGGGGGTPPPPPPPPAGPLTYADCTASPVGVVNTYLNTARPRREWKAATFLGDAVIGRFEYANATATAPTRVWYYKADATAHTLTTVGTETLDGSGNVNGRLQFTGLVNSTALTAGQSETVNYTVKTLLPAGPADRTERLVLTYETNEVVNLSGGRLDTCRVKAVISGVAGATVTPVSTETLHLARGLGFVKSYYKPTASTASDHDQTYLTEVVSSTGSLVLDPPTASSATTLTQCSMLPVGKTFVVTASSSMEANNAVRVTSTTTFNALPALEIERRNIQGNFRTQAYFYDPNVGYLMPVGINSYGSSGTTLVTTAGISGRPDLRGTAPLGTVNYTEVFTASGGGTSTSNDAFTFDGFARVTTPLGTYDTCKVRINYQSGLVETYFYAPNLHWVRLESVEAGNRTTRELISSN
ncbi:MAG TPA: hypothetical protein VF169_19180 [Albitalea sp.]|uniref:hypothetical protein n=1 Tax=Piscinibacter sp. TaxID=1903157 RepID=UPI002ED20AA5